MFLDFAIYVANIPVNLPKNREMRFVVPTRGKQLTRSHAKRATLSFSFAARMTASLVRARLVITVRFVSTGGRGDKGDVLWIP